MMKHKIILTISLIQMILHCCTSIAAAQEIDNQTSDSLFLYRQTNNNVDFNLTNHTALAFTEINKLGTVSVLGNYTFGHWRKVQEAEYDGNIMFSTKGLRQLGRFKLSGSFTYTKAWQDSLAFTTKSEGEDDVPYYFAAGKAGKFQRQSYHLTGILNYELLKNKLYLSSGVNYQYQMNTRSVDPRPAINTFKINVTPGFSYKHNQHIFGVFYKAGYGDEYVRSSYKNDDYLRQGTSQPTYPDRLNYLFQGYGFTDPRHGASALSSMDRRFNTSGILGNYHFKGQNLEMKNSFSYTVDYQKTDYTPTNDNSLSVGEYQLAAFEYTGIFDLKGSNMNQQFVINVYDALGDDFNYTLGASNYEYRKRHYGLSYLQLLKSYKKATPEYGLNINYDETEKRDDVTEHHLKYSYLDVTLHTSLYINNAKGNKLAILFNPSFRKSISSKLNDIPEGQISYFTTNVVTSDLSEHHYYNLDAISLNFGLNYINRNISPIFPINVKLSSNWSKPLDVNPSSSYHSSSRIYTQLAIGILL